MKKYPNGSQMQKKIILPTLTLALFMNLSSCDFKEKDNTDDNIKKNIIVIEPEQGIKDNIYQSDFSNDVEYSKDEGVSFPKILPNGDIEYFYKYGTADIIITFSTQNNTIKIENIDQKHFNDLGWKQEEKIDAVNDKYENKELSKPEIKKVINEILNTLVGTNRKTMNPEAFSILMQYLNGTKTEEQAIKNISDKQKEQNQLDQEINAEAEKKYAYKMIEKIEKDKKNYQRNDKTKRGHSTLLLDGKHLNGRNIEFDCYIENNILTIKSDLYKLTYPSIDKKSIQINFEEIKDSGIVNIAKEITKKIIDKYNDGPYSDINKEVIEDRIYNIVLRTLYQNNFR